MEMTFHDFRTAESADSAQGLRAFGWAELCARLSAAQDLRRVMARGGEMPACATGAFHLPSARELARRRALGEGAVNPTSSADGKAAFGTTQSEPPLRKDKG